MASHMPAPAQYKHPLLKGILTKSFEQNMLAKVGFKSFRFARECVSLVDA